MGTFDDELPAFLADRRALELADFLPLFLRKPW